MIRREAFTEAPLRGVFERTVITLCKAANRHCDCEARNSPTVCAGLDGHAREIERIFFEAGWKRPTREVRR